MSNDKTNAPNVEQRCPACGGRFTISPANRRKKVQCPQCREVVTLTEPPEIKESAQNVEKPLPPSAPPEWLARCEQLQARIDALEQQVEALMVSPRPHTTLLQDNLPNLRSGSRPNPAPSTPLELPSTPPPTDSRPPLDLSRVTVTPAVERSEPGFGRNFQLPTPEIGLVVAASDKSAHEVVDVLTKILMQAGWKVQAAIQDASLSPHSGSLTLAAAPTMSVQRVTITLNALRTAGYAVTYQLDPTRGPSEATLTIGVSAVAS